MFLSQATNMHKSCSNVIKFSIKIFPIIHFLSPSISLSAPCLSFFFTASLCLSLPLSSNVFQILSLLCSLTPPLSLSLCVSHSLSLCVCVSLSLSLCVSHSLSLSLSVILTLSVMLLPSEFNLKNKSSYALSVFLFSPPLS